MCAVLMAPVMAAAGGAAGLAVSMVIAFGIYHLGKRMNVALFFKVVGALLMVFAAGLLVDAVENLQQLGWLPVLAHPLWSTGGILSEDSALGDIVHSFFGYAESPTGAQLAVYLGYVVVAVGAFIWLPAKATRRTPGQAEKSPVAA